MNDPADQPTIDQLLKDFGIDDFLGIGYRELLAALEQRDNIMRTDAVKIEARKMFIKGLNKIIEEI